MPLFGFSWGRRDTVDDDDDEDEDAEYESYTDDDDDDDDEDENDEDDDDPTTNHHSHDDDDEKGHESAVDVEPHETVTPNMAVRVPVVVATTTATATTTCIPTTATDTIIDITTTTTTTTNNNNNNSSSSYMGPNLSELHNLLFLAIEADRVDIVQELLLLQSSGDDNVLLRNYLIHPVVDVVVVVQPPPTNNDNNNPNHPNTNDSNVDTVTLSLRNRTTTTTTDDNNDPNTNDTASSSCCTTIPPLHIAVQYGSIQALNYLLRIGANPAIRPNIGDMQRYANTTTDDASTTTNHTNSIPTFWLDVPHLSHYDQCTAWEVAFGRRQQQQQRRPDRNSDDDDDANVDVDNGNKKNGSTWSILFTSRDRNQHHHSNNNNNNLTASKLESIRHAFFTEAIRCISNDDVTRFQQLHQSGMPIDEHAEHHEHDDGHPPAQSSSSSSFAFLQWCQDFHAQQCGQYILRSRRTWTNTLPSDPSLLDDDNQNGPITTTTTTGSSSSNNNDTSTNVVVVVGRKIPVASEGLVSLQNRYEELDALCRSLSVCLDHVAEEVSVGAGLLLSSNSSSSSGGNNNHSGAQALASHVRTVKHQRELLLDECERYQDTYQNTLDELLYYIQQFNIRYYNSSNKSNNARLVTEIRVDEIDDWWQENKKHMKLEPKLVPVLPTTCAVSDGDTAIPSSDSPGGSDGNEDREREKEQHMITQIMILETKIRRMRATISDLSDDNQRNQEEIERRQLMVGLQYIRTLRKEIRDVEYQIYELKQFDIDYRTKIRTIQSYLASSKPAAQQLDNNNAQTTIPDSNHHGHDTVPEKAIASNEAKKGTNDLIVDKFDDNGHQKQSNNRSATNSTHDEDEYDTTRRDYTTTMVVHGPTRGFLSLNLWQILLRIIGMGGSGREPSRATRSTVSTVNENYSGRSNDSSNQSRPVIII